MFNEDQLRSALDTSGYIHEQRVAQRLEKAGFHVETNWIYTAPIEGKARELDVRAYKYFRFECQDGREVGVAVELLIECKSGTAPYVLFAREKGVYDARIAPANRLFPCDTYDVIVAGGKKLKKQPYAHLRLFGVDPHTQSPRAVTQFCKVQRDGKSIIASHADAHSKLILSLTAAANYQKKFRSGFVSQKALGKRVSVMLIYPIALVGGDVYEARVDVDAYALDDVGFSTLQCKSSAEDESSRLFLSFVSSDKLEAYLEAQVQPFVDALGQMMSDDPGRFTESVTLGEEASVS